MIPRPTLASARCCGASPVSPSAAAGAKRRRSLPTASPRSSQRPIGHGAAGADGKPNRSPRGATDKALAGLLFQGGLRRSEAAALTWGDVQRATDGAGVRVRVRTSKTNQTGDRADVRYLKNGAAAAVLALVLDGLNAESVGRRLTEAAKAAGIESRLTGHSGRVGLAVELTARGASTTETMLAGGWSTARMVAHYSAGATAELGAVAKYL